MCVPLLLGCLAHDLHLCSHMRMLHEHFNTSTDPTYAGLRRARVTHPHTYTQTGTQTGTHMHIHAHANTYMHMQAYIGVGV